jgi:hypothetical protein
MCHDLPLGTSGCGDGRAGYGRAAAFKGGLLAARQQWVRLMTGEGNRVFESTYSVPSQAMPTSVPVGQSLMRCHRPAPSSPFLPRQAEKSDRRSSRATRLLQSMFHAKLGSAVDGQLQGKTDDQHHDHWREPKWPWPYLGSCISRFMIPRETLKERRKRSLAVFQLLRICVVAFSTPPYLRV